jgi:hypothetical protein
MARIPAIDISVWDEGIDLGAWKAKHGIGAVIVKCGGNEGRRYVDRCFADHMRKAQEAGLPAGVYFYTTSTTVNAAIEDADYCVNLIHGHGLRLPVFMDVEDAEQFALSPRKLTDVIKAFCDRVQERGYRAGLYTGGYAFNNNMYPDELRGYCTWIASWQAQWPTYVGKIYMWQQGTKRLSDGRVFFDDVDGCQDFDWVEDYVIQGGGDVPSNKLSYALAAAEVMDHFVDHDAHGYSQPNRDGTGEVETITLSDGTEVSFQSGDRDCSRLIQTDYVVIDALPRGMHMWTGNEREILLANGFVEVSLDSLQRGDVLWRAGHTEMYMGDGIEAGARRSETGSKDGRTGDQDGGEITRSAFVRSHWTSAYRCMKKRPGEGEPAPTPMEVSDSMAILYDGSDNKVYYWSGDPESVPYHVNGAEMEALQKVYGLKLRKLDRATAETIMKMCKARKAWREQGIAAVIKEA